MSPKSFLKLHFVKFILVGFLNTVFGYFLFAVGYLIGFSNALALALAYCGGVVFNYLTTGGLIFKNTGFLRLPLFIFVYIVFFGINYLFLNLASYLSVSPLLLQALLAPSMAVLSYFTLSWVFKR